MRMSPVMDARPAIDGWVLRLRCGEVVLSRGVAMPKWTQCGCAVTK